MKSIKKIFTGLFVFALLLQMFSCGKKETGPSVVPLQDSVAQDLSYRLGKWYSISNGAGYNFTTNPLLDTIWFISDSTAGWTNYGGNPYVFRTTYFNGPYELISIAPDPFYTAKMDTGSIKCAMTIGGDTFVLYRPASNNTLFVEEFLKLKN